MESKYTTFCLSFIYIIIAYLLYFSTAQPSLEAATTTRTASTADRNYVKKSCNTTTYPKICYKSLSSYASAIKSNPQNLCGAALNLTLQVARNTSALVTSILKTTKGLSAAEVSAIKDCVEEIGDSIYELEQSLKSLGRIGGPETEYEMANMRTWVSAAMTDEDACIDGVDENKKISSWVRSKIRGYILNFDRMTSNALALINTLKY